MAFSITDLINGAGQEANPDGRPDTHCIDVDRLVPSEGNFYSMENIHELADAIELAGGVMQSLLVVPLPEGRYKIILRIQEIDDFVNSIDNSRIRRVIIKRFIRGKQQPSWQSIAKDLEWSDEGTPRKAYEKYINNLLHSENSENGLIK